MARSSFLSLLLLLISQLSGQSLLFRVDSSWGSGYQATLEILNPGPTAILGWTLSFEVTDPIASLWDGQWSQSGTRATVRDAGWNAAIAPGGRVSFGFTANGSPPTPPTDACLNGAPLSINGVAGNANCQSAPPPPSSVQTPLQVTANPSGRRIIGYYTAWSIYARAFEVDLIDASQLTHINYAFANISPNLEVVLGDPWADVDRRWPNAPTSPGTLYGNFGRLQLLKARHPHLKTLISVGGWTWSSRFSDAALTAANRTRFAASCVRFVRDYGFDGVDIDWEYPVSGGLSSNVTRPADRQNYTLLLAEIKSQLDAAGQVDGKDYLLSIAGPAGPAISANLELAAIANIVDWINLMAYDFHGSWSPITHFNAALNPITNDPSPDPTIRTQWNVTAAINSYLSAGVPADRLVLGVPFYGRGFAGVQNQNQGLFQSFSGPAMGTYEPAVFDWRDINTRLLAAGTRSWHPEAEVPMLYNAATGIWINYEDPQSIGRKADRILQSQLGGAMIWELSSDDPQQSLLRVLHDRLMDLVPTLSAGTSGSGRGDLALGVTALPRQADRAILLASATPAPGGLSTGPIFGLALDPLLLSLAQWPLAPQSPLHFPAAASPYGNGPIFWPAGSLGLLSGTRLELVAIAYEPTAGFFGASPALSLQF